MSLSGEMDRGYITCDEYLTCDEYFERFEEEMGEETCFDYKRQESVSSISTKTKITPRTDSESVTDIDSDGEMDSINTDGQFQENTEFLKKEKLVLTSYEKNNGCIGIQKQHGCLCPITLATLKKRNRKKKINPCDYRK